MGEQWNYFQPLTVSSRYKNALVAFSVIEILLSISSIGLAIPAIYFTRQTYIDCYNSLTSGSVSTCNLYSRLYIYSLTSQGIWDGVLMLISAAVAIDFTKVTTWKTWSYMNGFSIIANMFTGAMIGFEALAISEYINAGYVVRSSYDYILWCLHCALLAVACAFWLISTMKRIVVSRVKAWGNVAVANLDGDPYPPPQAEYNVPR